MPTRWRQCVPFGRIFEHGQELAVLGHDGRLRSFRDSSADLVRAMLDELVAPCSVRELCQRLSGRKQLGASASVVSEVLTVLQQAGAVATLEPAAEKPRAATEAGRVVVALSGGIAAAYAPALIELLQGRGFRVRAAATKNALRFVSAMALEVLTHERVPATLWPVTPERAVPHLELANWADLVVVYPATATTLSRIAHGDCSSLVSALAISATCPVVVVPAMNSAMLESPSAQRNLAQLKDDGFWITRPAIGFEVAEAPGRRKPALGAAPPVQAVVDLVVAVYAVNSTAAT